MLASGKYGLTERKNSVQKKMKKVKKKASQWRGCVLTSCMAFANADAS